MIVEFVLLHYPAQLANLAFQVVLVQRDRLVGLDSLGLVGLRAYLVGLVLMETQAEKEAMDVMVSQDLRDRRENQVRP
jgi:hypothetical protein